MINPWFKFYGSEYLSDPKIGSLNSQERSCWMTLLCMASTSSKPGNIEYLTVEVLLEKSGIRFDPSSNEQWESSLGVIDNFIRLKMIDVDEYGIIKIINWGKRQETSLTNAERQAKYRENKKSNEKVTDVITKVTLEENRIEKNILEKIQSSPYYLEKLPGEDLEEFYSMFDVSKSVIKSKAEDLLLYCQSKGKKYKNYRAFLLNALKKDFPKRKQYATPKIEESQQVVSDEERKKLIEKYKPSFIKQYE